MYAVQIISLAILGAIFLYLVGKYRRREIEWNDFVFWSVIVFVLLVISLFPLRISNEMKRLLGLGRGLDAIFIISIGLAYILLFKVYLAVDKTEREITELTRKIAIELEEIREALSRGEEDA